MTTVANTNSLPTRRELPRLSLWVWLLLGLAAVYVVAFFRTDYPYSAILGAGPVLLAAALMAVAPRQRLVALSAFSFAYGPTVTLLNAIFTQDLHDLLRMSSSGYYALQGQVVPAVGVLQGLSAAFGVIAVLALAFYLGFVRSRRGWWIVAIGVVLAVIQTAVHVASLAPLWSIWLEAPDSGIDLLPTILNTVIGSLGVIAWAYLTGIALDRGLLWFAAAGAIRVGQILLGLLSLVSVDLLNDSFQGVSGLLAAAFWVLLIGGVLVELPRDRVRSQPAPDDTPTHSPEMTGAA